jgi:hypothetical protein
MLNIREASTLSDFENCVRMYMGKNSGFLPNEFAPSMLYIQQAASTGKLYVAEDRELLAFILFKKAKLDFSNTTIVEQLFFCSDTSPVTAVKCVYLLHDKMVEWGERHKCELALSTCSHEDKEFKFTRLLEHHGWERCGYLAKKELRKI